MELCASPSVSEYVSCVELVVYATWRRLCDRVGTPNYWNRRPYFCRALSCASGGARERCVWSTCCSSACGTTRPHGPQEGLQRDMIDCFCVSQCIRKVVVLALTHMKGSARDKNQFTASQQHFYKKKRTFSDCALETICGWVLMHVWTVWK